MNRVKHLFGCLFLAVSLPVFSAVEMRDEDGNFRHHDPEVRKSFLATAQKLSTYSEVDGAIKLLKGLIVRWQEDGYQEHANRACELMFNTLDKANRLSESDTLLQACSPSFMNRQELGKLAAYGLNNDSHYLALQFAESLIATWQAPEFQDDLFRACQYRYWLNQLDQPQPEQTPPELTPSEPIPSEQAPSEGPETTEQPASPSCPEQGYTASFTDPGQSPLMVGYMPNVAVSPLNSVTPSFPNRAFRQQMEGYVVVEFTVKTDGSVTSPKVVEAVGQTADNDAIETRVFNKNALKAARQLRYAPKIVDGVAVRYNASYKFVFRLEDVVQEEASGGPGWFESLGI